MSKLKSLKFVEAQQEQKLTPVEKARSLLLYNLNRQLAAAQAMLKGEAYFEIRNEYVEDENGQRVKKDVKKPIRKWYWRDLEGQVRFSLRIRNKAIEIQQDKTDILIGDEKQLVDAISVLIEAVGAGELDKQIENHIGK
ncbi:hypothetical protein [Terasakiella pusilla]|uniref:hypothetical protein n=1 Tax=Terasakiella pusilla TaxID=64973 RepID=UPI003AA855E6